MTTPEMKAAVDRVCKELVDQGKLVEAGWQGLRLTAVPFDAPQIQIDEMRMAFFAGAQHLFSSILGILEEDREPTEADMRRMDAIHRELEAFAADFRRRHGITLDG